MAQYIDKDALVTEIERFDEYYHLSKGVGGEAFIESLLSFLDTLEVKDLQEEPVSEELGDYINELSKQFPEVSFAKLSRIAVSVSRWQQNQDVKNKQPKVTNRTELDEYAYQCAYDMSNDWVIENPTWHDVEDACKLGANWQKEQDQETIELAEDHAMLAGIIKGREHTIGNVRSILNKVAYENNGLDVNGDYCEQPYIELDNEFRKLLKEG